ncbi:lysosomal proton-coupled steroid conjugate and bile acid symporter SLC46A3 [Halyomorpha halys]|uniref:lysosomal proton-coupled steroid conjugate and bile acid symporter SLC46A3 n=1 Tax=Halyomorpha halys TaxID=286706 RepID=UPI0006D4D13E|nr:uncharacterized protein LOC106685418 [Halyomorpha halys]
MVSALDVVKPVLVSTFGTALVNTVVPNLIAQKVCSPQIPSDINEFICHQDDLVALATEIATTRNIVRSVCSGVSVGLFGAWRDTRGRSSPLLYIGVAAELVAAAVYIFASLSWSSSAWISTMIEAAVGGMFGQNILQLGANCLVISNTTPKERIMKLQLYLVSIALGTIAGDSVSGLILNKVGFEWFFVIPVALQGVALILLFYFVKEQEPDDSRRGVAETFERLRELFKSRTNIGVIWLMLFSHALINAYLSAEGSVTVYFTQQAFGFTLNQSTMYVTYHTVVCVLGAITVPMLLKRFLNWRGFKIGMSSSLMTTVSSLALAFVKTVLELYLVSLLDLLKYVTLAIPQFILSMCIRNEDLGLFLGFGSIASIGFPFAANYLYKYIFSQYHQTWPGAIYCVSAGCNLAVFFLLGIGYYIFTPPKVLDEENTANEDENVTDSTYTRNDIHSMS